MATVKEIDVTTKKGKYRLPVNTAWNELDENGWRTRWTDISENMAPARGRFLKEQSDQRQANDGSKKTGKIINGTVVDAIRIIAAGLQGGLTSPSRPWFVPTIDDKDLLEFKPVQIYLEELKRRMLAILARSNFYASTHNVYSELPSFGTGCMLLEEDFQTVLRCRFFTIGEYTLGLDGSYRPDKMYRKFYMSAWQLDFDIREK